MARRNNDSLLNLGAIVLAAGKGSRMKSEEPKVLHSICGRSLVHHVMAALAGSGAKKQYIVVGHQREAVTEHLKCLPFVSQAVVQADQKGTGHAVQLAFAQVDSGLDAFFVINGDGPLVRGSTLRALAQEFQTKKADLMVATAALVDPTGYGRVVGKNGGKLHRIVEEKEATAAQKKIKEVSSGIFLFSRAFLAKHLPKLKPSKMTNEIYLPELIALGEKAKAKMFTFALPLDEFFGVNDQEQLAMAEKIFNQRLLSEHMLAGVRLQNPESIYCECEVALAAGAFVGSHVSLLGKTKVEKGARIEAGSWIKDSEICTGAQILPYSVLEEAKVGQDSKVGPMARLRPGADIGEDCKIGNFVEIKKAKFAKGSKASHLSYIGDAEIGEDVNLGCGFITCNYDGYEKHFTKINKGAFIGSDVQMVAPIEVGQDAYVASGSTLTKNVPSGALAVARSKQENKEGYAERIRSRMQRRTAAKEGK